MLNLVDTNDKIEVVTSSTANLDVVAAWVDNASGTFTQGKSLAAIGSATTTDVVAAPGSSTSRNVKFMSFRNRHASSSNDATVRFNDNGTTYDLFKCTLLAGEELICREGVWFHHDANGGVYGALYPAATQGDMETGTSSTVFVTPSVAQYHPSAAKAWGVVTVSGGTPTLQTNYNITSITDTATDRLTVTIATDFSSANYCIQATIEAATTTYSATTTSLICVVRNASKAAGSFVLDNLEIDIGQATDPSSWSFACFGDQ